MQIAAMVACWRARRRFVSLILFPGIVIEHVHTPCDRSVVRSYPLPGPRRSAFLTQGLSAIEPPLVELGSAAHCHGNRRVAHSFANHKCLYKAEEALDHEGGRRRAGRPSGMALHANRVYLAPAIFTA
jgi:hypothetical protein